MEVTDATIVESIGYLALGFIALAFMFSDLRTIRAINVVGCATFIVYASLKGGMLPVLLANVMIICIHTYKARREKRNDGPQ